MQKSASTLLASVFLLATACCLNMTSISDMQMTPDQMVIAVAAEHSKQHTGCHEVVTDDESEQVPPDCNIANAPDSAFAGKVIVDFQLPTVSSVATVYAFALLAPESPIPGFARAPPHFFQHIEHKNTVVLRT